MPSPRRILHALHSFPPDSRGGIETYVELLAGAQAAQGLEPEVLAASPTADRGPAPGPWSWPVHRLSFQEPLAQAQGRSTAARERELTDLLEKQGIELLHVHHWHGLGPCLVSAARNLRLPTVVTLHDAFVSCPLFFRRRWGRLCEPEQPIAVCERCLGELAGAAPESIAPALEWRNAAYRRELEQAQVRLCLGEDQRTHLLRLPALAGLTIESAGFPARRIDPVGERRPPWRPPAPLRVATWGGLVEGKGLHLLVEAARGLPASALEIHHHGPILEPAYRAQLESSWPGGSLHFHGPFGPAQLATFGSQYDLAVHPSLFLETYGFTTDEALDLGLPLLIPDRGAPRERLGGRGTLFRFGDSGDLARRLREILSGPELLEEWRNGQPGPRQNLVEHERRLQAFYYEAQARVGVS
jgi:glycosyltransferase involved in cell wall biosynthesis